MYIKIYKDNKFLFGIIYIYIYTCKCMHVFVLNFSLENFQYVVRPQTKNFSSVPVHIICYFWRSRKSNKNGLR